MNKNNNRNYGPPPATCNYPDCKQQAMSVVTMPPDSKAKMFCQYHMVKLVKLIES